MPQEPLDPSDEPATDAPNTAGDDEQTSAPTPSNDPPAAPGPGSTDPVPDKADPSPSPTPSVVENTPGAAPTSTVDEDAQVPRLAPDRPSTAVPVGVGAATSTAAAKARVAGLVGSARARVAARTIVTPQPMPGEDPAEPTAARLTRRLLGTSLALANLTRRDRILGWVWPLAVMAFGGVLRFWRLDQPHELVFDETYYVKEGYSMLARGYEADWGAEPNRRFEAGDTWMLSTSTSERVVHPLVGKWLIAAGIRLGGGVDSSFAWRLAVAIAGTLAIVMVARIARRMFASTALGTLAGLFMAVDGMGIVMSRTGLLDPFLMVFVLGAFGLLLIDRDQARRRLARRMAAVIDAGATMPVLGPWLGVRWWRLGAAVLLGLACGVKWSGIYFLAVFGLMSAVWDVTARYRAGVRRWFDGALVLDAVPAGLAMVTITAATYVATWTSWFISDNADYRDWAEHHSGEGPQWMPAALRSWWAWHVDSWEFHHGLDSEHPYAASPAGWIIQLRPTSFYYSQDVSGLEGADAYATCGADSCSRAITSLGNPMVWWLGAAAVIVALVWALWYRDWRAWGVLSGLVAGWLPWVALYSHRTIFTFYAIVFLPWVVLTLTYVIGLVVGSKDEVSPRARTTTLWVVGGVVGLVVLVGAFFYPVWTAWTIPRDHWQLRMWLRTWI